MSGRTATIMAALTVMMVMLRSAAVVGIPPAINRVSAALIADDHSLLGHGITAVAATRGRVGTAMTGLGVRRSHDGKAAGEGEESDECFHRGSLSGVWPL